jgi:MFS family permease
VRELNASNTQLEWIVDAYNLMFAALVLAAGNLGDRVGRKGVLLAGLAIFGAATSRGAPLLAVRDLRARRRIRAPVVQLLVVIEALPAQAGVMPSTVSRSTAVSAYTRPRVSLPSLNS